MIRSYLYTIAGDYQDRHFTHRRKNCSAAQKSIICLFDHTRTWVFRWNKNRRPPQPSFVRYSTINEGSLPDCATKYCNSKRIDGLKVLGANGGFFWDVMVHFLEAHFCHSSYCSVYIRRYYILIALFLASFVYGKFIKKLGKEFQDALALSSDTATEAVSNVRYGSVWLILLI